MTMLIFLAQTYPTSQPAGETPWERIVLALVSAAVVIALAWIGKVSGRTAANKDRLDRHGKHLERIDIETEPTKPPPSTEQP